MKEAVKRETIGKISSRLLQKQSAPENPIDLEREMHTHYEDNIWECIDTHRKIFPDNFFIVVITKKEPLMPNVLRNYFFSRLSCPTPDYDQTVYLYDSKKDEVELWWVIPNRETCHIFKENALHIIPEERDLLKYILDFSDGSLMKKAQIYNKEIKGE